ncbi:hypothetical protein AJ80_01460 [Polytolypa hystricis UAMH7299]|uniref:UBL3-like ubiquitin domain-containing protein n=1 Tax=Polytolypa hystricis (strain UAMH7299) TaxID=1447883 RepID=A0A2B7Z177_POLH7|nr:hypothetical protein AJ80_01460 [Polytolypa hystricis UAMH7299]
MASNNKIDDGVASRDVAASVGDAGNTNDPTTSAAAVIVESSPQEPQPQQQSTVISDLSNDSPSQEPHAQPDPTSSSTAASSPPPPNPADDEQSQPPSLPVPSTAPTATTTTTTTTPGDEPLSSTLSHPSPLEPKTSPPVIGPSTDQPSPMTTSKESEDAGGPSLVITLLLTTGARHPFKIDGRYLRKRAVNVADHDPFAMSVYTLKELIWREWRSEWEPRPSSPSSIRLISFGKLLDDKAPLSDSKFNRDAPNVVHMTVKPQEVVDDEDAKAAKGSYGRERETDDRSPGCRCVIL